LVIIGHNDSLWSSVWDHLQLYTVFCSALGTASRFAILIGSINVIGSYMSDLGKGSFHNGSIGLALSLPDL
jgi:hypothetical protein